MSPIGSSGDYAVAKIDSSEHVAISIPGDSIKETSQAGVGARIAFVGAKALQAAAAVYVVGAEWSKGTVLSAGLNALKPWLYYGEGDKTEVEKNWAVVSEGTEEAAGTVLKSEAGAIVTAGVSLGVSSLAGAVSKWFWGPTHLVIPNLEDVDVRDQIKINLKNQTQIDPNQVKNPVCDHLFNEDKTRLLSKCYLEGEDKIQFVIRNTGVQLVELPYNSWAQSAIDFVFRYPTAMKTLQDVSHAGINTLASSIVKVTEDKSLYAEDATKGSAWKTRLAEISMGLGELGVASYLAYSGALTSTGMLAPLFILPPVLMSLVAKEEMEEGGNARLNELKEELAPLAMKLHSEKLTPEEQVALIAPFEEKIKELQHLQSKEKQAAGLMPKQREWEELHDSKTHKIGAAAYQALRSAAGCLIPFVGIQSVFSTTHLLSSRAITALTGDEQLGRWALPAAAMALTMLAQSYSYWS